MVASLVINIEEIEKFYRIEEDGSVFSLTKNRYLKAVPNKAGYLHVCLHLYQANKFFLVHRLVAAKYIGPCPVGKEVFHKDDNKLNNHYLNVEYLTHKDIILKSYQKHNGEYYAVSKAPLSYETKQLMAQAKKKPVQLITSDDEVITYGSIEEATQSLSTYRKKVYRCIMGRIEFKSPISPLIGILSFPLQNPSN